MRKRLFGVTVTGAAVILVAGVAAAAILDFGVFRDRALAQRSDQIFGIGAPVATSSTRSITAEEAEADPAALVTVSRRLKVLVVSASPELGADTDMIALWPDDANPSWLITCNESGPEDPGVQRIELATGEVETIVTGTSGCDGIRRTPWGTILFSEEEDDGALYELIDPLGTTDVTLDRDAETFTGGTGAENLTVRPALGSLAFEGFAVYSNGVVYYGDENRPFEGAPGGAYFKFIPSELRTEDAPPIATLDESPLADGAVYGLRLGLRAGATDYGHGTNYGLGIWVALDGPDLRAQTAALHLTGYYRPEDIDIDRAALSEGLVRFCSANAGNEGDDRLWGEVVCVTDGTLDEAASNAATPEVQLFQPGHPEFAMPDNVAYQPGRGNWIIHEDGAGPDEGRNNDIWDCAPDGADDDLLSDGCLRILTLNDLEAETTGGVFNGTGNRFFVSIQHNVTGHGVVLQILGWK